MEAEEKSEIFPWDENALETFKTKIHENKIKCRMDDIFLLGFLRARKYDQERSLELLKNYYVRRKAYNNIFKDLLPSKMERELSLKFSYYLPNPDQNGRCISIYHVDKWDTTVCNYFEMLRVTLLNSDYQLNLHRTQVNGMVFIIDVKGFSWGHFFQSTPRNLNSALAVSLRNTYQLRVKELHYVNINVMLKQIMTILMPLFPRKIRKRMHFHSDMKELHKFIHPRYLPEEFGGDLPNYDAGEYVKKLKENEALFRTNEEYLNNFEIQEI